MRFGAVAVKAKYITQREYAEAVGITPSELSQINQDHLLPTRDKLRRLCEAAGCTPTDVYTTEELDLVGCMAPQEAPGEPKDKRDALYKRLSFRVPRSIATTIPDDLWPVLGWDSYQEFGMDALNVCLAEYAKRKAPAGDANTDRSK